MIDAGRTQRLASARLQVVPANRSRAGAVLLLVLVALAAVLAVRVATDSSAAAGRDRAQQDTAALRAEVARLQAELALERATRAGLEQQVTELNHRATDLEGQLAFLRAQGGPPRR